MCASPIAVGDARHKRDIRRSERHANPVLELFDLKARVCPLTTWPDVRHK